MIDAEVNMKALHILTLVFCLLGVGFSQDFERGEIVKGFVKDRSGAGISNVNIFIKKSDGLKLTSITLEDGYYEIVLPSGSYDIEFIAPRGFDNRLFANFSIKAKSYSKRKLNVVLEKNSEYRNIKKFYCKAKDVYKNSFDCDYATKLEKVVKLSLKGVVTNYYNNILSDVSIKAVGENYQNFLTKTNKNGFYYLVLPEGKYQIEFEKKGYKKFIYLTLTVNKSSDTTMDLNIKMEEVDN
jgi:hypothetical protein